MKILNNVEERERDWKESEDNGIGSERDKLRLRLFTGEKKVFNKI